MYKGLCECICPSGLSTITHPLLKYTFPSMSWNIHSGGRAKKTQFLSQTYQNTCFVQVCSTALLLLVLRERAKQTETRCVCVCVCVTLMLGEDEIHFSYHVLECPQAKTTQFLSQTYQNTCSVQVCSTALLLLVLRERVKQTETRFVCVSL